MTRNNLAIALLVCIAICACRAGSENSLTKSLANAAVNATAENMYYLQEHSCFVFETNVVVTIGTHALYADKVVAYQVTNGTAKTEEFSMIVASGNVRLDAPGRTVKGATGVWNRIEKTIRVCGNAAVREKGGREVVAQAIIYDMERERITFEGRTRVRALVNDGMKKNLNKTF